jgi:hypothetical protein
MKTAITLFTAVLALSGCSLESLRPSAPAATDTTTHDNQSTVATLPPSSRPACQPIHASTGSTGATPASVAPRNACPTSSTCWFRRCGHAAPGPVARSGHRAAPGPRAPRARTGGDAGRKRSGPGEDDAIDPVMRKYCQDPDSLTPSEQERFRALGGVKAIPSLAKHCRFNK